MSTTRVVSFTHSKGQTCGCVSGRRGAIHPGPDPRNPRRGFRRLRSAGWLSAAIIGAVLLANPRAALAAPDPPFITNNIAYYQGNQSNGISLSSDAISILRVNELTNDITSPSGSRAGRTKKSNSQRMLSTIGGTEA